MDTINKVEASSARSTLLNDMDSIKVEEQSISIPPPDKVANSIILCAQCSHTIVHTLEACLPCGCHYHWECLRNNLIQNHQFFCPPPCLQPILSNAREVNAPNTVIDTARTKIEKSVTIQPPSDQGQEPYDAVIAQEIGNAIKRSSRARRHVVDSNQPMQGGARGFISIQMSADHKLIDSNIRAIYEAFDRATGRAKKQDLIQAVYIGRILYYMDKEFGMIDDTQACRYTHQRFASIVGKTVKSLARIFSQCRKVALICEDLDDTTIRELTISYQRLASMQMPRVVATVQAARGMAVMN